MNRTQWSVALFWGACWGLIEATLGYGIHLVGVALPGLPGFLMFPAAVWILTQAYRSTQEKTVILRMSLIAASIKLIDFMIPGHDPIRILNPAISILMEGAAVYAVIALAKEITMPGSFLMGVLWRGCFLIYMIGFAALGLPAGLVTSGLGVALRFLILESLVNALLISAMNHLDITVLRDDPKWQVSMLMVVLALGMTWAL